MRVLLFGTFDHLHPGHQFVLSEAAKRGEVFVVVARDRNVERIKGRPPDQTEDERKSAVMAAVPDAVVVLGDPEHFLVPVREIRPDLIILGYDQRLPPGVTERDLPCPVERLPAHHPDQFKSSLRRNTGGTDPKNLL